MNQPFNPNHSNLRNRRPNVMGMEANQAPLIITAQQREQHEMALADALMENAVNYRNSVMASILGGASLPYADDESDLANLISKAKHSAELTCVAMGFVPSIDVFREVEKQLAKRHPKMVELLKAASESSTT